MRRKSKSSASLRSAFSSTYVRGAERGAAELPASTVDDDTGPDPGQSQPLTPQRYTQAMKPEKTAALAIPPTLNEVGS